MLGIPNGSSLGTILGNKLGAILGNELGTILGELIGFPLGLELGSADESNTFSFQFTVYFTEMPIHSSKSLTCFSTSVILIISIERVGELGAPDGAYLGGGDEDGEGVKPCNILDTKSGVSTPNKRSSIGTVPNKGSSGHGPLHATDEFQYMSKFVSFKDASLYSPFSIRL